MRKEFQKRQELLKKDGVNCYTDGAVARLLFPLMLIFRIIALFMRGMAKNLASFFQMDQRVYFGFGIIEVCHGHAKRS
jgi:hypothetical protein